MPHFSRVTTDGTVLGARELGRPDRPPDSVIYTGPNEPDLRVVDVLGTEEMTTLSGSRCSSWKWRTKKA